MRSAAKILPILALCLGLLSGFAATGRAGSQPVTVFAAASLKNALDEAADRFAKETGVTVVLSYGGSSALARQIQYGAPAQVFLSANTAWMDVLDSEGLLADGTRIDLLTNRLALISGKDNPVDLDIGPGVDIADALGSGRLAMALVNAVPAGIYGKAALDSLGIWHSVEQRIAQTDNVRAALRLVAIGEAPLGIVYATDALADEQVRVAGTFPADSHPPILYPAAILSEGDTPQARAFLDFLKTDAMGNLFLRNGFGLPGSSE